MLGSEDKQIKQMKYDVKTQPATLTFFYCINEIFKVERLVLFAPLAQLVEHRPFKAGVPGSSPGRGTTWVLNILDFQSKCRFSFIRSSKRETAYFSLNGPLAQLVRASGS